jgi:hypothetical protein
MANDSRVGASPFLGATRTVGRLRFLGPLLDLVAIGIHRPALSALLSGEEVPAPAVDRAYLLKILDEEISRPFGHPLRPIVELLLNAVDAVQRAAVPGVAIDVRVADGAVEVSDPGEGMDLGAILTRLLVPFATDRVPGVHLGRFGVGFFSVLGLGAADPASFALDVETGDGRVGFLLRVAARGRGAASFTAEIHETAPRTGTRVRLRSAILDGAAVRAHLEDALHFFPPERAVLRVDGVPLNDGSLVAGGRFFEDPAGPGLRGRFHVGGRGLLPGITAAVYHAGVKVRACYAVGELALLDFPDVVELTEGRDALKPGPAFAAVVAAFHRRLARLGGRRSPAADEDSGLEEGDEDAAARLRLAELAAQISALMLESVSFREAAPELARALLYPGRFLVSADRVEAVVGFLGPGAAGRVFAPESFWAVREWQGLLPGERELLEDELSFDPPEALSSVARRRADLPGLALLVTRARAADAVTVMLARGRRAGPPPGALPCLGARGAVLVRADAEGVRAPGGWRERYALQTSFDRALGVREPEVERHLIVDSPLRAARAPGGGGG